MRWSRVAGADYRNAAVADDPRPSGRTEPPVYADTGCPAERTSKEDSKEKTLIEGEEETLLRRALRARSREEKAGNIQKERFQEGGKESREARDRMRESGEEDEMTEKKFRPGWYQNDPDPLVTISDLEKAYVEARSVYEATYSHPGWGDLAKTKARLFIDVLTMTAHNNQMELSATAVIRDCVSRWDEFRRFVHRHDRRIARHLALREPSLGALLKAFEHAVHFSIRERRAQEDRKNRAPTLRDFMKECHLGVSKSEQ